MAETIFCVGGSQVAQKAPKDPGKTNQPATLTLAFSFFCSYCLIAKAYLGAKRALLFALSVRLSFLETHIWTLLMINIFQKHRPAGFSFVNAKQPLQITLSIRLF